MFSDALTHPTDVAAAGRALDDAATTASHAPSIHNTQPWQWRQADVVLDLRVQDDRTLSVTDPDARLATLSCGAALHHARVSLAAHGWRVHVHRFPDPADPRHLARLHVEGRAPLQPAATAQLRAIPMRHTDRRPVTGQPVTPEQLQVITAAATAEDTWLHTLTPDQVIELAGATDHAQRVQAGEPAWTDELATWSGGTRPGGTGVPDTAIPERPTLTTVPSRDFGHRGDLPISTAHDAAAVFVLLYGPADEPRDWLRAGEALSAAWLTATMHGVSVVPFSAPIEVLGTRQALRVMLASIGYPYLVLRLGQTDPADAGPPGTPRLPTDQTVTEA